MVSDGAIKVVKVQFPDPSLARPLDPFGNASPMGLLWTLLGASPAYSMLAGAVELLAGLLLTARRTALLGALVSLVAVANVLALNLCYDVPVKLFSARLLAMTLFAILPDGQRLVDLSVLHRAVPAAPIRPLIRRAAWRPTVSAVVASAVVAVTGLALFDSHQRRTGYGDLSPEPPLYGIWNVEELTVDGAARPPRISDEMRWRRWAFDRRNTATVQRMDDSQARYRVVLDPRAGTLTLTGLAETTGSAAFRFQEVATGMLALTGTLDGKPLEAHLRKVDNPRFLLRERGFRRISEAPFNR